MAEIKALSRRIHVELQTPSEKAIGDALKLVENMGADPRLTEASVLLSQARSKVADYVDELIERSAWTR